MDIDVKGKKITVAGLGVSGKAAAELLSSKGARVYVTDSSASPAVKDAAGILEKDGIPVETGAHTEGFVDGSGLLVVSPGIKDSSLPVRIAKERSIPVIGEIELASWFCKGPIIAVTGTNGKTTTTTLIGLMLDAAGKKAAVCGNIGEAFSGKADTISADQIAVVEVSSFQLMRTEHFRPKVAAITNISQNHFDWHLDFDEYFSAKKKIYRNQKVEDSTVLNYDDHYLKNLEYESRGQVYFYSRYNRVKGAYFDGGYLMLNTEDGQALKICSVDEVGLKGLHNVSNILCASVCSHLMGADIEAIRKVLFDFKGLPHRFQYIADINGIRFIDDSKATTVDACRAAISSCKDRIILIAGGRDKGSDFSAIRELMNKRVKALVLIGEAKEKIKDALEGAVNIYDASDMHDAVHTSSNIAMKGDIVLLSPMCASFDMYKDYKERGEVFCDAVNRLKAATRNPQTNYEKS